MIDKMFGVRLSVMSKTDLLFGSDSVRGRLMLSWIERGVVRWLLLPFLLAMALVPWLDRCMRDGVGWRC
jgi:hypothetical protein